MEIVEMTGDSPVVARVSYDLYSPEYKRGMVLEWANSGSSQKGFAREKGIPDTTFSGWVKKWRAEGCPGLDGARGPVGRTRARGGGAGGGREGRLLPHDRRRQADVPILDAAGGAQGAALGGGLVTWGGGAPARVLLYPGATDFRMGIPGLLALVVIRVKRQRFLRAKSSPPRIKPAFEGRPEARAF